MCPQLAVGSEDHEAPDLPAHPYFHALGGKRPSSSREKDTPTSKEHVAKKDSMNSSELWYSTVSHDVKHEVSVIDNSNQTEYALVSVPKKADVASPEEHSEYDDVLVT
ncbi:uncharacterized protein ACIQIH_002970 isoform 1-T1 [Cyanocitta cristata]